MANYRIFLQQVDEYVATLCPWLRNYHCRLCGQITQTHTIPEQSSLLLRCL
ncbi:hypothetical protein EOL73_01560 [Candidatus Saccharibacteria bacterium]|nr:hypothetical protein [Candidatus Saccharibacteria bacterium]NCU40423.1 hypothetical protein [Candidatus Saccharibacteria bacterium]